MIIFFHGFISNNEALDMSVFPGMIYNRHRPALIKHCEARMLFGLYQQDGSSSRLERYDESGLDNLKE